MPCGRRPRRPEPLWASGMSASSMAGQATPMESPRASKQQGGRRDGILLSPPTLEPSNPTTVARRRLGRVCSSRRSPSSVSSRGGVGRWRTEAPQGAGAPDCRGSPYLEAPSVRLGPRRVAQDCAPAPRWAGPRRSDRAYDPGGAAQISPRASMSEAPPGPRRTAVCAILARPVLSASDLAKCGPRSGGRTCPTKGAAQMVLGEIRGPRRSSSSDVAQHQERGAHVAPYRRGRPAKRTQLCRGAAPSHPSVCAPRAEMATRPAQPQLDRRDVLAPIANNRV